MAYDPKKVIDLEEGWTYMEVCGIAKAVFFSRKEFTLVGLVNTG